MSPWASSAHVPYEDWRFSILTGCMFCPASGLVHSRRPERVAEGGQASIAMPALNTATVAGADHPFHAGNN